MDDLIPCASWMRDIRDDAPLTTLSIPGTHNSCSIHGPLGFAKTQDRDLSDQLVAGIRFIDIRLAHYENNLCVHHDVVCMERSYTEVLTICSDFLGQHPSETILLSISNEDRFDSALGKFAPSEVLCTLSSIGNPANPGENTRSFEDTFRARTWEHIKDAPLFYNFTATSASGEPEHANPAFTSETRLGDVRGKIILLRRFEGDHDIGFDATYWPENQRFRSAAVPVYDVEDRYQNPGGDDKFDFVVAHLEDARSGNPEDLYVTFSSAVDLTARGYAETMNPRLNDYLAESPQGRVGVIVMDYFARPRELVANVIKVNTTTGRFAPDVAGVDPGS
ncbi:MAG: phosphatidylinositol-specific phospholipase C [Pseudonocardiales bacterium]|nr:phosphatidylinositol-specific phospholipase C [Pseudonocardiales bacterium]